MIPIGLALGWAGYAVGIWGYCLIRGYDVTFTDIFKTTWPGGPNPANNPLLQDKSGAKSTSGAQGSGTAKPISGSINAQE